MTALNHILQVRFLFLLITSITIVLISILIKVNLWNNSLVPDSAKYKFHFKGDSKLRNEKFAAGKVFIKRKLDQSFEEGALILLLTVKQFNLGEEQVINLCSEGEVDCYEMDIRAFIHQYFEELKRQPRHQSVLGRAFENGSYSISEDSEGLLNVNSSQMTIRMAQTKLKALGMMLALTLVTQSFLDVAFHTSFFVDFDKGLDVVHFLLAELEGEQLERFLHFKRKTYSSENLIWLRLNSKEPLVLPFSKPDRPMEYLEISDDIENVADMIAEQIFLRPYRISYALIDQGFLKVLGTVHYNVPYLALIDQPHNDNDVNRDTLDFRFEYWKIMSDCDRPCLNFWRALARLQTDQQRRIYQACTGYSNVPQGFVKRLPMTQFYSGDGEIMFPDLFKVVINPEYSEDDYYIKFLAMIESKSDKSNGKE